MKNCPKRLLLLPLLALGLTLALGTPVPARAATSATLQINFGSTPHWSTVPGTRVRAIRATDRSDYDIFRYNGAYYAFHEDHWYMSRRGRGEFRMIDDRYVPRPLYTVPRGHWRSYPSGWMDRNRGGHSNHGRGNERFDDRGQPSRGRGNGR